MFQKKPDICPICRKGREFEFIRDFENGENRYSLHQCLDCQVQFWLPMKNLGNEWYEKNNPYKIRDIIEPKIFRQYHKNFLNRHKDFPKDTKVLDLGCCTGEFIFELKKRGCDVFGVDSDEESIRIAKKHFALEKLFAMPFDEFFKKADLPKFDVITFFEVIQYLNNPLEFIENVKNLLKPDGIIVLSVPCRDRMFANLNEWDFPHTDSLTRWNKTAILNLFKKFNFNASYINYLEQFKILSESVGGKIRTGLVNKSLILSKDKNRFSIIPKVIYFLGRIKSYFVSVCPAFFLWITGKIFQRNNGIILIELKQQQ